MPTEVSLSQKHLLATVATAIVAALPGHSQTRAVYTASQAAEGLAQYQTNCASCHLPDLSGRNEAPQLAGGNFMNTWGPRTTTDLIRYIQSAMPPSNRGGLSEEICSNIVAFFLQANGAPAGNRPLAISLEVRIGSVADGQMPPDIRATLVKAANADQAMARPTPVLKGLTVSGEVRNYQPVTDEMLRHPDPADWLIVRGNYQAWNCSPLAQITPQNVNRLQLAWVWAMNDGGANQPAPVVHNGIIYLTNTSNTLQALNGRTRFPAV